MLYKIATPSGESTAKQTIGSYILTNVHVLALIDRFVPAPFTVTWNSNTISEEIGLVCLKTIALVTVMMLYVAGYHELVFRTFVEFATVTTYVVEVLTSVS